MSSKKTMLSAEGLGGFTFYTKVSNLLRVDLCVLRELLVQFNFPYDSVVQAPFTNTTSFLDFSNRPPSDKRRHRCRGCVEQESIYARTLSELTVLFL